MKKALRENNPETLKQYYRELVEMNRRKCEDLGIPYREELHRMRALVSAEEQLKLLRTTVDGLGNAVIQLLGHDTPLEKSMFVRSFQYPEAGLASHASALRAAAASLRGSITVYPPLLCRSRVDRTIVLEGSGGGSFIESRNSQRCSVVVVFQSRGPVILIVRDDARDVIHPHFGHLYSLMGGTTPRRWLRDSMLLLPVRP